MISQSGRWAAMSASPSPRRAFQRDRMPDPASYDGQEGLTLIERGEWRSAVSCR